MTDQDSIMLVSNDGFQFIVRKSAALKSPAIKGMLNPRSKITLSQFLDLSLS
jgi:hypothetical protein